MDAPGSRWTPLHPERGTPSSAPSNDDRLFEFDAQLTPPSPGAEVGQDRKIWCAAVG